MSMPMRCMLLLLATYVGGCWGSVQEQEQDVFYDAVESQPSSPEELLSVGLLGDLRTALPDGTSANLTEMSKFFEGCEEFEGDIYCDPNVVKAGSLQELKVPSIVAAKASCKEVAKKEPLKKSGKGWRCPAAGTVKKDWPYKFDNSSLATTINALVPLCLSQAGVISAWLVGDMLSSFTAGNGIAPTFNTLVTAIKTLLGYFDSLQYLTNYMGEVHALGIVLNGLAAFKTCVDASPYECAKAIWGYLIKTILTEAEPLLTAVTKMPLPPGISWKVHGEIAKTFIILYEVIGCGHGKLVDHIIPLTISAAKVLLFAFSEDMFYTSVAIVAFESIARVNSIEDLDKTVTDLKEKAKKSAGAVYNYCKGKVTSLLGYEREKEMLQLEADIQELDSALQGLEGAW